MKKGTYVSRAVYSKSQAENHRLRRDLKILVMGELPKEEVEKVRKKWYVVFRKMRDMTDGLRELLLREEDVRNKLKQ